VKFYWPFPDFSCFLKAILLGKSARLRHPVRCSFAAIVSAEAWVKKQHSVSRSAQGASDYAATELPVQTSDSLLRTYRVPSLNASGHLWWGGSVPKGAWPL